MKVWVCYTGNREGTTICRVVDSETKARLWAEEAEKIIEQMQPMIEAWLGGKDGMYEQLEVLSKTTGISDDDDWAYYKEFELL